MSDEAPDPLPGILADLDQAVKAMPLFAKYARACYDALREEGFSDSDALQLTRDQIDRVMNE